MRKISSAAAALAISLAAGSGNAATILFDMNGAAAGGVISLNTFDWAPDNALAQNAVSTGGIMSGVFNYFEQAKLFAFVQPGNVPVLPSVGEFTLFASYQLLATGSPFAPLTAVPGGSFQIFFSPADSNQLAGTGYNNGTLILQGSVVSGTFTFLDFTRQAALSLVPLDQFGTNDHPGVLTDQGSGSSSININVTFAEPTFFLSPVTSLTIDALHTANVSTPFVVADPAFLVGGQVPVYGTGNINGGNCPGTCDFQFQSDGVTTFNTVAAAQVPEPGSVALLSLAVGALGFARRRKAALPETSGNTR
jgi:hypothetical protein